MTDLIKRSDRTEESGLVNLRENSRSAIIRLDVCRAIMRYDTYVVQTSGYGEIL